MDKLAICDEKDVDIVWQLRGNFSWRSLWLLRHCQASVQFGLSCGGSICYSLKGAGTLQGQLYSLSFSTNGSMET